MRPKTFLFYLVDTPSGACYFIDENGNLQTASIHSGLTTDLSIQSPDGWINTQLSFIRNAVYFGINRSFSLPMKFVRKAAKIVRELYYTGKGIETPITLIVLKYNQSPRSGEPLYKLYYKGQLDLKQIRDFVAEGAQVNLMEGGMVQLLKTYENTVFEIPCDGSIPENVKVNLNGVLLPDTFHYQVQFSQPALDEATIPCNFLSNDGDNFGIIHNDPNSAAGPITDLINAGADYIFQSIEAITVRIKGSVTIRPYNSAHIDTPFWINICGSNYPTSQIKQITPTITVDQQKVVYFDATYDLAAGEKLYLWYKHNNVYNPMAIVAGNFDLSFNSKAQPTSAWCIDCFDLFKLIVKSICQAASTTDQVLNYGAVGTILEQNRNLLVSSGDAIRASGDANYQKFFQEYQLNINQPNGNVQIGYGPSIKTSLSDFFKSFSAILCGSLGNQQFSGENETIFFEGLGYVFNQEANPIELGEVANLQVSIPTDLMFNELSIGYDPQEYDQKAGKYEYNTKAEWVAPIKTLQKKLEIISKYRTDSYGIERLRADIGGNSTTRNSSDNSVFVINANRSQSSKDAQTATFSSSITDPYNGVNTNIRYLNNYKGQGIGMTNDIGSYLAMNNDPAIFIFTQATYQAFAFSFSGTLNGSPANSVTGQVADYIIITLFIKGIKVYSNKFTSTSADTAFSDTFSLSAQDWAVGDCIYAVVETSLTGSTTNLQASFSCGLAGAYWTALGSSIEVLEGLPTQLIALPNVTAPFISSLPVISYGFQYFLFNSLLVNSTFDITAAITAVLQPGSSQNVKFNLYVNGLIVSNQTLNNDPLLNPAQTANLSNQQIFSLGDIVFLTADLTDLWVQVQSAEISFTSTTITKFELFRKHYDAISGIPNTLGDTTLAGAPYNIEQLTPKRMLKTWSKYVRSILFNQIPGTLKFLSLSKNQYLSTTLGLERITENEDVDIHDMDMPLFYPIIFDFNTKVPLNFSELLTTVPNAHIHFTYNGVNFYGFPMEVKQKPAIDESQEWKLLCSPKTDIQNLVNLDIDGLNYINMPPNSLYSAFLNGTQFVPAGQTLDPQYHTKDMNAYWFSEQIDSWVNQRNYFNPWQSGKDISVQLFANGLSPVIVYLYRSDGTLISTTNLTQKNSYAVVSPMTLWEGEISTNDLPTGIYYLYANAGGSGGSYLISEGYDVRADWPGTILFEYSNSVNKQAMIFDTGFGAALRVMGFIDNRLKPKFKAAFYVDQPQDITVLNGIPYETRELWVGMEDGVPDYVIKKLMRIMLLDNVTIDGIAYSLDEGAEWEETFIEGNPKKYWKTTIRLSQNIDGISVTAEGISDDTSAIVTVDANAFGPNTNNTSTGTADIISITTS